ncbi:MAG: hypothetical protein ACI4V7_09500 [Succinivibrionaceae bacterium]
MENQKNVTLNDLSEGAIPVATPKAMPHMPTRLNANEAVEVNRREVAQLNAKDQPVTGTGNPMIDDGIKNIDPTIERLRQESLATIEEGKIQRAEESLDSDIDNDDINIESDVSPKKFKLVDDEQPQQNDYIAKAMERFNDDKEHDLNNIRMDEPNPDDERITQIVQEETTTYSDDNDRSANSIIIDKDIDDDLGLLDDEESEDDDEDTTESEEQRKAIEAQQKEKTEKIYDTIRKEMSEKFKPVTNTIDLNKFRISKKTVSGSRVLKEINDSAIECADGVLYEEKRCVRMSALSALEIEKLDPSRARNGNETQIMIDRMRLIYDHIIDESKPSSFNEWAKTVSMSSINDYFFTLYKATFGKANIITYTCECDNVFLQTKPINDMIKFRNDEVKDKYFDILHNGTRESKPLTTELFQISDDYVAELRKPSLYDLFIEQSYIPKDFSDKYSDLILLLSYIENIYMINRSTGELLKIDTKPDFTNKTLTAKRRIKIFASIIKNLNSDQLTNLSVKTNDFDEGELDEDGNKIINISYQTPETVCPKCGKKIEAQPDRPDSMVFTRHQLGLLSKI